jgi:hypothetical protein
MWLNFIMDDQQFSYITNMRKKNPGLSCQSCSTVCSTQQQVGLSHIHLGLGVMLFDDMIQCWPLVHWSAMTFIGVSPGPSPSPPPPTHPQGEGSILIPIRGSWRRDPTRGHCNPYHASHWWIQKSTKWLSDTKPAYVLTAKEEQRKQLIMNLEWVSARWKLITLPSPKCWTVIKIWNRYPTTRILFYFKSFFHLTDP